MIKYCIILVLIFLIVLPSCRKNTDPAKPINNPDDVSKIEWIDKKLTSIPVVLYKYRNIKELNLNFNKINSLPNEISRLQSLTSLNLNNNKLSALPVTIGTLSKLQYLSLIYNNLQFLPIEIQNLRNLKILHLEGNPLPEEEIAKIDSLLPNTKVFYSFKEQFEPVNYYGNHATELLQNGIYKYAIKYAEKAVKARPDLSQTYLLRAVCRYNIKDKNGACIDIKKAIKMNNQDANQYVLSFCN